jgi:C1A family cysteine protease
MRPVSADLPRRVNHESLLGPAEDQGFTSECVAYAAAGLKRFHEWRQSKVWLGFDPHPLYQVCKTLDGHPELNGTSPRVAMEVLRTKGMAASDGTIYGIETYARQTTVDGIRQALASDGPVILGIRISIDAFNALSNAEIDESKSGHLAGHCMLIVGYDDELGAFRVRNSWGTSWGDNGHLWLDYGYLERVDPEFDAWSSIDA